MIVFGRELNKASQNLNEIQIYLAFAGVLHNLDSWDEITECLKSKFSVPQPHSLYHTADMLMDTGHQIFIEGKSITKATKDNRLTRHELLRRIGKLRAFIYKYFILNEFTKTFSEVQTKELLTIIRKYTNKPKLPDAAFTELYAKYLWADGQPFERIDGDEHLRISTTTSVSRPQARKLIGILGCIQ
jgi:replicative DNA helicase